MTLLFDGASSARQQFLVELGHSVPYLNWRKQNPGEAARFDQVIATNQSVPMLTWLGRALVTAVTHI